MFFSNQIVGVRSVFFRKDFLILTVEKKHLNYMFFLLKNSAFFQAKSLVDITAVDYFQNKNRFQINYVFISYLFSFRVIVRCSVSLNEAVLSTEHLFPSAVWLEREVWDMFGVFFSQNSDLRRILTDYGFRGHPLRKNFPVFGFFECRYDEETKSVVNEPIQFTQEFRLFDFKNPWQLFKNLN
jgi:NADH-quinone oxidoreductase subunit C